MHLLSLRLKSQISIPASHAGGDERSDAGEHGANHFNPRLPCGRRLHGYKAVGVVGIFQSPPPMREATPFVHVIAGLAEFQSPPPMREATAWSAAIAATGQFQSPPPMREATHNKLPLQVCRVISIPASHAGGDWEPLAIQSG